MADGAGRLVPNDADDPQGDDESLEADVAEALAGIPDADRDDARMPLDRRWLGIGLRLGLERPDEARRLLAIVDARTANRGALADSEADDPAAGRPAEVPARSALLARSAAVPFAKLASLGPEAAFGWAAMLSRSEVQLLGRVVHEMLATGAPADLGRGFGLAWDAGVKLPRNELDQLFRQFTELEMTVASVLAGRDLRSGTATRADGGGLFGQLIGRGRAGDAEAAAALESSGEPGKLGLVASWNAWIAMRYRSLIPASTFELLVQPWTTVVGSLPEA
jgi:hypothetical protein